LAVAEAREGIRRAPRSGGTVESGRDTNRLRIRRLVYRPDPTVRGGLRCRPSRRILAWRASVSL